MKAFYIVACCFFLMAIASEVIGERYFVFAMTTRAKAISRGQAEQAQAKELAQVAVRVGYRFEFVGMGAAALGLGSWFASFKKGKLEGKRLTPVIPLVLFIAYVMFMMVIV